MDRTVQTASGEPPPPTGGVRRALRRLALALGVVAVALGAAGAFLASEAALHLAIGILVARSEGRLTVDEPAGSLLSAVRVKRLAWKGPEAALTADEIALTWSPAALWSQGIVIHGLGAQRITVAMQGSDAATPLPQSLALPTDVAIDSIAVGRLDWTVGTSTGTINGIAFGYQGGARAHRIDRLSLVTARGTITGTIALGAIAPFALDGKLAAAGDAMLKGGRADVAVSGTLASVALDAAGRAGDADFTLRARLSPLAAVVLDEIALEAKNLDLATWDAALPATRISGSVQARPVDGALAGRVDAANAIAGPLDAQRLPVRSLAARFAWRSEEFTLDDIVAQLGGGGRVAGRARVPLTGGVGRWTLDARDVDLKQLYTPAVATRLSGSVEADLESSRQRIVGDVADRTVAKGIGLAFAATVAEGALVVERFRVRAGDGELAGSGRLALAGERAFAVTAKAKGFDPSRFGDLPAGNLGADVTATGALQPVWRVAADVALVPGSRLAGVPVSGSLHGTVTPRAVRDAAVDVKLGSAALTARGAFGGADDRLSLVLDAPRLADIAPLLPPRLPRPLEGTLSARLDLRGDLDRGGIELEARGSALRIGATLALATFDARIAVAPSGSVGVPATDAERRIKGEMAATGIVTPPRTFTRASASVEGTLAQHKVALALAGEDLDVAAAAHGALRESRAAAAPVAWVWSGAVDALENRGPWALRLAAPATLEIARDRVHVGATRIEVADGSVDLAALAWDDGRVTTRGTFSGVPVATLAKLAGRRLPFVSTLTLAGDWSLAAAPRLNGTLNVRREHGDLFLGPDTIVAPADRAFRLTAIDLSARVRDDAVEATATLRSDRGANADAQLTLGVAPDAPPGRITAAAPLQLALTAEFVTLQVLQPWVGTAALVDGNLRAELAARGTLGRAPLSGTLRGSALRISAPQHGVHFTDGRLSATLAEGAVRLDELSFAGGAGRFTASGTLAAARDASGDGQGASARIAWHAEHFRVFNRPDRRLVAGGSGTLSIKDRKLWLDGAISADEGHFEYTADARATLSDDVVVKGWPDRAKGGAGAQDFPLTVDLELDLGENLTFVGEGLDTGLRGKVRVTTAPDGSLRGRGSIRAVNGTYRAFGQRLVVDRGQLIFDGPIDNPGLDIVALRKNLAVEAGVAVSGTVRVPIIQLTSNPPVPDNEKLSWLVLGKGLDRTSGGDVAALQAASAALLGRGGRSVTTTIAESIGLDDISVHAGTGAPRGGVPGTSAASGQVVAFGKRLTDRLSLVYEQGLTVATNALRLEYSLSQTLTLRAEAGAISGIGIYYRRTFD